MIKLDLTSKEREMLNGVLESNLSDLRTELSNTTQTEARDRLEQRRKVIQKVIDSLAESADIGPSK